MTNEDGIRRERTESRDTYATRSSRHVPSYEDRSEANFPSGPFIGGAASCRRLIYEWRKQPERKQPYTDVGADVKALAIAGLWERAGKNG